METPESKPPRLNSPHEGHHYDASTIQVLEGIEHVRKRPNMYIGDTGKGGLHHLVYEVVDNSIDEALEGYCSTVGVTIHDDGSVSVSDDGRGIPTDLHQELNKPALEVILTTLHSGGKFDHKSYRISGGLHGVGVSVVNALSEWLEVEVYRGEEIHFQSFERGQAISPLEKRGKTTKRGTLVRFKPDAEVFDEVEFDGAILEERLRELAFLNRGIKILLRDERTERSVELFYEGGIQAFVEHLSQNKDPIHDDVIFLTKEDEESGVQLDLAFQYNRSYSEILLSFVNNINTREGGTHVSGFKSSLTRALNQYAKEFDLIKGDKYPSGDDFREGLTSVISVRVPDPQFEAQTKIKLCNRDVQSVVEGIVYQELSNYLRENPAVAQNIIKKGQEAARVREETRRARDLARRKGALFGGGLPGKLADCSSGDRLETELYIVEGDSAAGTAKQGRDRRFQAILPLRGKILNVEKARIDKMLAHNDISTIIKALGTGIGPEEFNLEKVRYGRIIIMTDADVDGSHIRTLLLTFVFRHMSALIENGQVYIAQPPLYRLSRKGKEEYVHSEDRMTEALLLFGLDRVSLSFDCDGQSHEFDGEALSDLMHLVVDLDQKLEKLKRKGIDIVEFLSSRDPESGRLPVFHTSYAGKRSYFFDDVELNEFIRGVGEEEGREMVVVREEDRWSLDDIGEDVIECGELRVASEISDRIHSLETSGFSLQSIFGPPASDDSFHFEIRSEDGDRRVDSLRDALDAVLDIGQKGLEVTRYKGLGEMNAEQLWTTTMNPETRTLKKVRLQDTIKADKIFSILMGVGVGPRKEFIERHALEARNLDV